ncbi:MAG: VOC family protein [Allosphingosinicella sp.]
MPEFAFGGPRNGIIQMAYTVADIHDATRRWIDDLQVGPWFLLDHFSGVDAVYRGAPGGADVSIAMAFAGHIQIELIQPNDRNPSVFREAIERKGYGFHHFGRATDDIGRDIATLEARGHVVAFRAGVPTGGEIAYMDRGHGQDGFLELISATPMMEEVFTRFWRASVDWDGAHPIRPFA